MVTSAPTNVDGLLVLDLQITDPEIIYDLGQHPGQERNSYAVAALRLGLMALRQARGELDVAALKYESSRFLSDIERTLSAHANNLIGNLSGELARYFDPFTGNVSQRIERLIKDGGELDLLLRQHLDGPTGTLARTLALHLGDQSPIFKLLSPTEKEGVISELEKTIGEALSAQKQALIGEFTLDAPQSALSRLVREVTDANGKLKKEFDGNIQLLLQELSLNEPESALSRLVREAQSATRNISQQFSMDDEGSSLSRLARGFDRRFTEIAQSQQTFQTEVRETLATLISSKAARFSSTLHGLDFQADVGTIVGDFAGQRGHVHENTTDIPGSITRCKVGDHVVTLGTESASPGRRLVVEAKEEARYSIKKALDELETARKNRNADVGVFVFSFRTAPPTVDPIWRVGKDVIVIWDPDLDAGGTILRAALSVAVSLLTAEQMSADIRGAEVTRLGKVIERISRGTKDLAEIRKWADGVKINGAKIAEAVERQLISLEAECKALEDIAHDLGPASVAN